MVVQDLRKIYPIIIILYLPVENTASYTRDSKSLISSLEEQTFPHNWGILDVKSLCLNIPQQEGFNTALEHLFHTNSKADELPFPETVAKEIMQVVLQHNYFEFNSCMYKQVRGTAMGTKMAPAFANLFMASFEKEYLANEPTKPLIMAHIHRRICPSNEEQLKQMLERLNAFHLTIKFTFTHSTNKITFLDLELYKGPRFQHTNKLDVRPHHKSTNSFQYLQYSSSHPKCTHTGIVKGELIWTLRACTDEHCFNKTKKKLLVHFRDRGYPSHTTNKAASQAQFKDKPAR